MEFVASGLNSRQLLGLLFICENRRKNLPLDDAAAWEDLRQIFADRFTNLSEELRFEVLEAHLMSVEDIDIYNNETLQALLEENAPVLQRLSNDLEKDPRFGGNA